MSRAVLSLVTSLALLVPAASHAEDASAAGQGLLAGLLPPLSAEDLADLASGAPLVLTRYEATGGATADGAVAMGADGGVAIKSQSQASATVAGSPVTLTGGAGLTTGAAGEVTMENGAGIATLQLASGFNNLQQTAVSSALVLSGLPQF